jgi:hypothetical protein
VDWPLEGGITIGKGHHHIEESLSGTLKDADNKLTRALRGLLMQNANATEMQYL